MNEVLKAIYERRSIRHFTDEEVPKKMLLEIVRAGTWAPSGLNNQPWRFALITDKKLKAKFEPLTKYSRIIKSAAALIPVFVDKEAMYHKVKDYQAIGACLQNMLLALHSLGLGGVWLGEIIKSEADIREILGLSSRYALMAVLALGWPAKKDQTSSRMDLAQVIIFEQ